MQPHALTEFAADLIETRGAPQVLDVEYSIQINKPTLTGSLTPSSYYIRPPEGTSAEELIGLFEKVPGFEAMNLTLTSIMGIDTYHQPLISVDDFAKKYFVDNQKRIVRVVGKSDAAIEAMAAFIDGLKRPFSAAHFPEHDEFLVSGYRAAAEGKRAEVKLLFKPGDPTRLMRLEHLVKLHLAESNLAREIRASRHYTREQAPELILSSNSDTPKGNAFLEGLAQSLPRASGEDVAEATAASEKTAAPATSESARDRLHGGLPKAVEMTLAPAEQKKRVLETLAGILRQSWIREDLEIQVGQRGTVIDVKFPRSARTLWLGTSFNETRHIDGVRAAIVGVKADPLLRDGWDLHYQFDSKAGALQIRAVDAGAKALNGAKAI